MAGKRQHTIPQFLQRGFASAIRGKNTFVFMYRKGLKGREINTENVGVETHFYGQPGHGSVDDVITDFEYSYSPFVNELRVCSVKDGPIEDQRIPRLINHLCMRTRSLRASVHDSIVFLTERLHIRVRSNEFLLLLP
jgi:hypothetical protein